MNKHRTSPQQIEIRGAHAHNLKHIDVDIPLNKIVGIAGAGAVKVTLNGHYACQRVELTEEALKEDKDMLEALLAAAISDASAKVNAMTQEEMANLTGGMGLPGGFKLPF